MDEFSDSVRVALLPTTDYWCHIDLPHVTLVYAGEIPNLRPSVRNELAKATLDIAMDFGPFTVNVIDTEIFGGTIPIAQPARRVPWKTVTRLLAQTS